MTSLRYGRPLPRDEVSALTSPLTPEQQEIKDEFIRVRGGWADHWETTLRLDPAFMRA
jgi:hypothetical protein